MITALAYFAIYVLCVAFQLIQYGLCLGIVAAKTGNDDNMKARISVIPILVSSVGLSWLIGQSIGL